MAHKTSNLSCLPTPKRLEEIKGLVNPHVKNTKRTNFLCLDNEFFVSLYSPTFLVFTITAVVCDPQASSAYLEMWQKGRAFHLSCLFSPTPKFHITYQQNVSLEVSKRSPLDNFLTDGFFICWVLNALLRL